MATELKLRRDVDADVIANTPAEGELWYNITTKKLHVGDASTVGGTVIPNIFDAQKLTAVAAAATGTDTLAVTLAPAPAAYTTYQIVVFETPNNNTGAVTLNVNALGAKTIKKNGGADDLGADDLIAGGIYTVIYDGTNFQLISGSSALPAPDFTSAEQTVALDTLLDVAHSLGAVPSLWSIVMRCKTANLNYAAGDEVVPHFYHDGNVDAMVVFSVDATNMTVVQGGILTLIDQSSKNVANITVGSWKWVMRAWL